MADQYGLFWDSFNGDRVYNASSFEEWLKKFFYTGVFNGDLEVTANGSMVVEVGNGYCNVEGKVRFFDQAQQFTISPANGTYPRIDTVVIERNDVTREITMFVVEGDYSGDNPQPTPPVRTGGIYQIVLANIHVDAGITELTQANIEDTRPNQELCGWVVGTVDAIDVEQITAQAQADFEAWYENIKGQLSDDAAGHLQLEIDEINDKIELTVLNVTLYSYSWNNAQYTISNAALSLDKVKTLTYPVTITDEQYEALTGAGIRAVSETNGTIVLQAYGTVPDVDIPIQVIVNAGKVE